MTKKKLNLDRVLVRILELMVRHPVSSLTFSKVSRLSKVPRSTLYYYFGSSREMMIREAVKFGMEAFTHLLKFEKDQNCDTWTDFSRARLRSAVDLACQYPWAPELYFRYRNDPSPLGQTIRDVENAYLKKITLAWKRYENDSLDPCAAKISSYVKLGILWGFAVEREIWISQDRDQLLSWVDKVADSIDLILKTRLQN